LKTRLERSDDSRVSIASIRRERGTEWLPRKSTRSTFTFGPSTTVKITFRPPFGSVSTIGSGTSAKWKPLRRYASATSSRSSSTSRSNSGYPAFVRSSAFTSDSLSSSRPCTTTSRTSGFSVTVKTSTIPPCTSMRSVLTSLKNR